MKREGTIAATFLAIAAVVGFSLQSGTKTEETRQTERTSLARKSKPALKGATNNLPGCRSLQSALEDFLETSALPLPDHCSPTPDNHPDLTGKTSHLKFVIALLPDPVHTHLPVPFDQFAVAIQDGAQDENYDFDSSWVPWDQAETPYALLADDQAASFEKELKENQPGIILFRKALDCPRDAANPHLACEEHWSGATKNGEIGLSDSYRQGLVVFVVGEDATHGIHKAQFRNALAWIKTLQPNPGKTKPLAVLGPAFSGSLSSLSQMLSEPTIITQLDLLQAQNSQPLAIYSGSVSSKPAAQAFQNTFGSRIRFHSFVQNDDEILRRFCKYIIKEQSGFDSGRVAIISEDQTAYGRSGMEAKAGAKEGEDQNACPDRALKLYYPRDISALRSAYQTKSLFDAGTSSQPTDTQRRSLPTDLADPTGTVHDSLRSYGGNQTPLTQEAFLMEIVTALRELHARYILLRSSNTLDQLFLTNFLRRSYPDGRIVILGSDLMFIRERGATGLSGTMTLSTYPLFPLARDWTEHQILPAADRVFGTDTSEGTYIAFRLLLNDSSLNDGSANTARCYVIEKNLTEEDSDRGLFLPPISCSKGPPIPDYSPPFWMVRNPCGELKPVDSDKECSYPGPDTWLSVIGVNRFWPMASLTKWTPDKPPTDPPEVSANAAKRERATNRETEPGGRPETPLGMKVFWLCLLVFSLFHAWCCWSGSFTAKPSFRAHFASTSDRAHTLLIFGGTCCVAYLGVVSGWGCGAFSRPADGLGYSWFALAATTFVCLMAWLGILASSHTAWRLSKDLPPDRKDLPRMTDDAFHRWNYRATGFLIAAIVLFGVLFVVPIEMALLPENQVLTYWRAMHLASGVSPLVPILAIFIGLYFCFWFTLHGLALFGPDRPCLPPKERLVIKDATGKQRQFLKMFSQEDAGVRIEQAAMPLDRNVVISSLCLFVIFLSVACIIARGIPVRSLGAQNYAIIFLAWLVLCCSLSIVEAWRLYHAWSELKRLLTFLDRLPLRRTLGVLRGFSWGSVWRMSGNVLDVRYKVISRQMECMNHSIASLDEYLLNISADAGAANALHALTEMRDAGLHFADWYSSNCANPDVGDLTSFKEFQKSIASASGTLLTQLLVPAWRKEKESLLGAWQVEGKEEVTSPLPPQAKEEYIRNAEEFVCLNYLDFIQNVLGRLRTMAVTIVVLFLASTVAMSTYPFDPRQALSAVLIALFVVVGIVIVMVYADMHRDATLSHVTNTKPGELGPEFWFKIIALGFAPLIGLLTRVFPGITDFVFSWLQPGISSLK
jgi:hypothetical protein